jgi:isoquinoline 1-oxidoreductase beta subunit
MSGRRVSRRVFLVSAGSGAALVLGFHLARLRGGPRPASGRADSGLEPNLWIRIETNGDVHLRIHKCEMGQGVLTALAMLLAEELEADWSRVRVVQADADFRFADQNTSGSSSISDSWLPLRRAGAIARTVLVRAAP